MLLLDAPLPPRPGAVRRSAVLLRAAFTAHPGPVLWGLLGALLYGAGLVAWSVALGDVLNSVVIPRFGQGHVTEGVSVSAVLALLGVGVLQGSSGLIRRWTSSVTRARFDATLREAVADRYLDLPMSYHQATPTGEQLAHASTDPEAAAELPARLPMVLGMLMLLAMAAGWALLVDPLLAVIGAAMIPALAVVNSVYQKRVALPAEAVQEELGRVTAVAHESFDGAFLVKTLGRGQAERDRFAEASGRLRDAKIALGRQEALLDSVLEMIPLSVTVALVMVGGWQVNRGMVSVGTLVSFINLFGLLVVPLRTIGNVLGGVPLVLAGYDRVQAVLAQTPPPPAAHPRPLPAGPLALSVRDLGFGYPDGPAVLSEVSFDAPPGATVAVTGGTGSGKSTLMLLLAGLLAPVTGGVRLGGVDLNRVAPEERTAACAVVFQEPFLFAGTLAENVLLDFDPEADPRAAREAPADPAGADGRRLTEAIDLARVTSLVEGLPDGLATRVGERGITLSGGERQRIALARALARGPRVLLLDEATSAVDAATRQQIMSGLTAERASTTTIVVTSSADTLALADSVVYLDRGRVAGIGTHAELLGIEAYDRLIRAYDQDRTMA